MQQMAAKGQFGKIISVMVSTVLVQPRSVTSRAKGSTDLHPGKGKGKRVERWAQDKAAATI